MFRVTKELAFCFGHRLMHYPGKCRQLHGHNARAVVTVAGSELDSNGMLTDFSGLRRTIGAWIDATLDHKLVLHKDDPLLPVLRDMGDPVFVCWVLLWTGGQVFSFLSGDFGALSRYWHGNIFYPEPLTLAYSEHFTAQMLQALPVLAVTDNVVLAYNLLFLSTFVLCGLGTFLLVRDLTDSMYDPRQSPWVSHARGNELMAAHVEQYWCPTVLAADLTHPDGKS